MNENRIDWGRMDYYHVNVNLAYAIINNKKRFYH
jgi:hypothetical protein